METFTNGFSYGETAAADWDLCKKVYEELERNYPGHPWAVGCYGGSMDVKLNYIDPRDPKMLFGFRIHVGTLKTHDGYRKVRQFGGEILERFDLARRGYRDGDAKKAIGHGLDVSDIYVPKKKTA